MALEQEQFQEQFHNENKQAIKLRKILNVKAVQSLMDDFYALTQIGVAIIDLQGEVLVATGWQDVCTQFHRVNSLTRHNCIESDTFLTLNVKRGEFLEYKCKNNMWDIVTPIFVSDEHVGNLFLGQFFYSDETIDIKRFEYQAEIYGFDKNQYLDALRSVPRWSRDKVKTVMNFYSRFAGIISELLTSNLALEKSLNENKRTIHELKASNMELEQFAYVASHDLREPLRMVASYTELLARRFKDNIDSDAEAFITFIKNGVNRMNSLINDLLKYSRVTRNNDPYECVDCNRILSELLIDLQVLIKEKDAELKLSPLPVIRANPTQIKQLFQNLIENAIKFNDSKKPEIIVSSETKGNEWVIAVKDNGIGIASEYYEKVFTLFQRLHRQEDYPGTGLGLAVAKKIVEQYGGRIWIESEPGNGSTFYFTFSHVN